MLMNSLFNGFIAAHCADHERDDDDDNDSDASESDTDYESARV